MNLKNQNELIKRSHERSKAFGVKEDQIISKKILNMKELSQMMKHSNNLLEIASPFIDDIYQILSNTGFIVVLTDRNGCILSIKGKEETIKAAEELNMIPGAYMDEKSIGTNAMGTALNENTPIQITAKEHFISAYHKWTCSAAPIHNSQGEIIGSLNLTADKSQAHPHTLGVVISTVKAIENYLDNLEIQKQLISSQQYAFALMNHLSYGVIAVDDSDQILWINDTACRAVNIKRSLLINTALTDIFPSWFLAKKQLNSNREYINQEDQFSIDDLNTNFIFNAYKIQIESNNKGYLVTFGSKKHFMNVASKIAQSQSKYTFDDIITQNARMLQIIHYAQVVSKNPSTILITGESGTGKEVFAQSIHANSERKDGNFIAINCGAIPEDLLESELFGYEAGAFTGAKKEGKKGKFEIANGGTLFLDEIADLPISMQVKLLRAIQENYIVKVGGNEPINIDVRLITATNKDLKQEIEKENFRLDLYYRINVIEIKIPPLRERPEDILDLSRFFLRTKAEKLQKPIPELSSTVISQIQNYEWPGNIRELENFIEKAIILNGNVELMGTKKVEPTKITENTSSGELKTLQEIEKEAIIKTIHLCHKNMSHAAKALNIGRNTLYQKMKKYNIE